jgi:hypothetical protein
MNRTKQERRRRRSDNTTEALRYQLAASREASAVAAMVLADEDGLCLAASGDGGTCDEVAARLTQIGARARDFAGTVFAARQAWGVELRRIAVGTDELFLCAVGGDPAARRSAVDRSAGGVARILGS